MESEFTMDELTKVFNEAIANDILYIGVLVQIERFRKPELCITRKEDFVKRLKHFRNSYTYDREFIILNVKSSNHLKDFEELITNN